MSAVEREGESCGEGASSGRADLAVAHGHHPPAKWGGRLIRGMATVIRGIEEVIIGTTHRGLSLRTRSAEADGPCTSSKPGSVCGERCGKGVRAVERSCGKELWKGARSRWSRRAMSMALMAMSMQLGQCACNHLGVRLGLEEQHSRALAHDETRAVGVKRPRRLLRPVVESMGKGVERGGQLWS